MSTTYSRRSILKLMGAGAGVLGAGALAACAPSTGGGSSSSPSAAPSESVEPTNFSFAAWSLSEEAPKPVIEALVGAFGGEHGIQIAPVSYPYNEYLNQLTLQVQGGQFTGAAQIDVAWLGALASMGKLRDLSALTEGRGYTDAALQAGQYDATQYGLPWTIGAIGLVSNSALLQQAGVEEPPVTIEDFEAALVKLQGLGNGIIPYAASTKVAQLKDILVWMQTFGSPLLEGDTVTIGDDASVEAITWYKSLYDRGLIAPDVDRFDARALFSQGRAAIYDDAIVGKGAVVKDSPDPDLASKLDPISRPVVKAGDDPRAMFWGHAIVVVDGEGADTAGQFAQWITSDEDTVVGFFEDLGLPPTTEAGLASDVVSGDAFTSAFSERITATATTNPFWKYPQYAQMETAVAEQVQAVLVGSSSPADAMNAAGEAVQALV